MGKPETISKLDKLKVLGEAKRSRAEATDSVCQTPGGRSTSPPSGQPVELMVTRKRIQTATQPLALEGKATEFVGKNVAPKKSLRGGGESRPARKPVAPGIGDAAVNLGSGTLPGSASEPVAGVAPGPRKATLKIDWSKCPVCAARRMAKKAAMKKWRKKTKQAIRKD